MGIRESKLLEKITSTICSALIPVLIEFIAILWWINGHEELEEIPSELVGLVAIVGVLGSIMAYGLVYGILPRFKIMRQLGKYEGRWLEIIPKPPQGNRFFSIIDFTFSQKTLKYQLNGINFYTGFKTGISFESHKFIERTFKNGFYYITNPTSEHKNGLGKIAFVKPGQDNLTRAEGYFFDSGADNKSTKHDIILIKCDKKLVKRLNLDYTYKQLEKADSQKVMELLESFANEQKNNYNEMKQGHRF